MAEQHYHYEEVCEREDCPFSKTISDLDKTVFKGNGTPALTVQISNLATKIDTTRNLVLGAFVGIPVILMVFQWALRAMGIPIHVIAGN